MNRHITPSDLLSYEDFAKVRSQRRQEMIQVKKNRRVPLGPNVMIFFENFETLVWQIQEMLHIEKGGEDQLQDELQAYNPLVPKGNELVSTIMIEVEDPVERAALLADLGYIEDQFIMRFGSHVIHGVPEGDVERTTPEGKTSSVHFIHWPLTPEAVKEMKAEGCDMVIECKHPNYRHKTILPEQVRLSLINDL